MVRAKRTTPVNQEKPQVLEITVEEETPAPVVNISLSRDSEGRIVLSADSLPKRIAGNDDALPETLRQFGQDIVARKLV